MSYGTIALILAVHYVADFLLQSDWMAQNKSKAWKPLLVHIGVYTAALLVLGPLWAVCNGVAHLVTDYFTSRATSRLFAAKEIHWAFAVIGLDQLVHTLTLLGTWDALH